MKSHSKAAKLVNGSFEKIEQALTKQRLAGIEQALAEEQRIARIEQTLKEELRLVHAKLAAIQIELAMKRGVTATDILRSNS